MPQEDVMTISHGKILTLEELSNCLHPTTFCSENPIPVIEMQNTVFWNGSVSLVQPSNGRDVVRRFLPMFASFFVIRNLFRDRVDYLEQQLLHLRLCQELSESMTRSYPNYMEVVEAICLRSWVISGKDLTISY